MDHRRAAADLDLTGVPDHDGRPRPADDRFFGPPPPVELTGPLRSASTTWSRRESELGLRHRLTTAALGAAFAFVATVGLQPRWGYHGWRIPIAAMMITSIVAFILERRRQACSYVGRDGAWLVTRHPLARRIRTLGFRFADATRVEVTRGSGALTAQWFDGRRRVLTLCGDRPSGDTEPPARPYTVVWTVVDAFAEHRAAALLAGHRELPGEVLDDLVAGGRFVLGPALHILFASARWVDLDELAGTASTARLQLDPLLHAWALLELEDPQTAVELDDGSARMACIRARAAIARGDLDAAARELEVVPKAAADGALWAIATADLCAARGDDRAALEQLQYAIKHGYAGTALATSAWPSARLAQQLLAGPYR